MRCFYALRRYGPAVVALSFMAAASMNALPADKNAKSIEDWEIRGDNGNVMSNTAYALRNITSSNFLYWKPDGRVTISDSDKLGWDTEHKPRTIPQPRFEFVRIPKEKTPSPLKSGDAVAIALPGATLFNGKPSPAFLVYTNQERGINLAFSTGTGEQWVIEGGPKGEPIKTNAKIALYNKAAKDYVIYAEREHGINLRWNGEVHKVRDHRK